MMGWLSIRSKIEARSSTSYCICSLAVVFIIVSLNSSVLVLIDWLAAESALCIIPCFSENRRSVPFDAFLINFDVSVKY